jgi:hypothetical protein
VTDKPIPFPRRSWDDEATLLADLTRELEARSTAAGRPMELILQPASAFQIASLLQLALRHPDVPATLRAVAARYLTGVRDYFADCPAVLEALKRGDR